MERKGRGSLVLGGSLYPVYISFHKKWSKLEAEMKKKFKIFDGISILTNFLFSSGNSQLCVLTESALLKIDIWCFDISVLLCFDKKVILPHLKKHCIALLLIFSIIFVPKYTLLK
jgi:hypothetical protein